MLKCIRCGSEYDISMISKRFIDKNVEKYKLCTDCRKFKKCLNCEKEFYHKQNQTCSIICAKELKEKTYLNSCGTKHNFSKKSSSRINWENNLLENEGIKNVFQRKEVKEKSKKTNKEKYGVEFISQNSFIKEIKKLKIQKKILESPNFYKDKWHETHIQFINTIGYDPRLHVFGKASKESLLILDTIYNFCIENGILEDDIYIGKNNKQEFFITENRNIYFYDFTIRSKKIIIEFHGITFHAKIKNQIWKNPFTNETAAENIEKRCKKNNAAKKQGFKILELWSDKLVEENINICKKFINKNI